MPAHEHRTSFAVRAALPRTVVTGSTISRRFAIASEVVEGDRSGVSNCQGEGSQLGWTGKDD